MSDQNKAAEVSPQNNAMPSEPTAQDETITTLNNAMPSEPATEDDQIVALNNAMPAPPALGLGGK
ncbi:hypothetical protein GCM10010269_33490 [Streptomyces humidus]|uniref:Sigma-like protein n=1 Tax=Streptomyces humidus TaxID=52259 RepID=A0A918FVU6_9ACTN|nr:hypothetical protein [Streptomyces humidus]GGR91655.1 hypothetical protein GCM10010269_33490 [Streptomyces humidus]